MTSATRRRRQSGNTMLETALCLMAFLLLVFGIVEYSRLMYAWNFVAYAARSAARYASLHGASSSSPATTALVQSHVRSLGITLNPTQLTVNTTWTPDNQPGSTVSVAVAYTAVPILTNIMPNAITVRSTAQMVVLQ